MEHIIFNATGRVRREVLNGKEYLVAPLTMIVPGVLEGSQGPLYYPPEEVAKNPSVWNGYPLVVYHPTDANGKPLSASDRGVLDKQGVGFIRNAGISSTGCLVAEGWFDKQKTMAVDRRVYEDLVNNRPIELSTGVYTDNVPAKEGTTYRGRPYVAKATNYRPDHLAILPDQRGACSLNDGCGVLVKNRGKDRMSQKKMKLFVKVWNMVFGGGKDNIPFLSEEDLLDAEPVDNLGKGNWSLKQRAEHATKLSGEADALSEKAVDNDTHKAAYDAHMDAYEANMDASEEAANPSATKSSADFVESGKFKVFAQRHKEQAELHKQQCDNYSMTSNGLVENDWSAAARKAAARVRKNGGHKDADDASNEAFEAEDKAKASGSKEDYEKAAELHKKASDLHDEVQRTRFVRPNSTSELHIVASVAHAGRSKDMKVAAKKAPSATPPTKNEAHDNDLLASLTVQFENPILASLTELLGK